MCIKLYTFLEKEVEQVKMICGCPGVGKSVEVYSYAMWLAVTKRKRVIYMHGDEVGGISIVFKYESILSKVKTSQITLTRTAVLLSFLVSLLGGGTVDLIVLDGSIATLFREVYLVMIKYPDVKLILCTSFRALGRISSEVFFKAASQATFQMESWTESEYRSAMNSGALMTQKDTTFDEHIFYSGGSIRLFQQPIKAVITFLNRKIETVPDMDKLVGIGGVGDASDEAVNSIMAVYANQKVVLSKYVTRMLLSRVKDGFIAKARLTLEDNPVWQGWVTEFEVLSTAGKSLQMCFYGIKKKRESWTSSTKSILTFDDERDEVLIKSGYIGWLRPLKWNHPCFDAFFRVSEYELRVVQITDAVAHSCKLKYLIPYVTAMQIRKVDFIFVCRRKNFSLFKVFNPTEITDATEKDDYQLLLHFLSQHHEKPKRPRKLTSPIIFRKLCYEE